jgi:phosphatidylinositol alpha-mannosyltransferase
VIRDGIEGVLTPPKDVERLAWALVHLLTSPAERQRLRNLGRLRAEVYSWERVAGKVEAYYLEVLGARALPRLRLAAAREAEAVANRRLADDPVDDTV